MELKEKIKKVEKYLDGKKVLVAFSGGADSTLVAKIAKDVCKEAIAITIDTGVLPPDCIQNARNIAEKIGIQHEIIKEDFLEDEAFRLNPPNRCYVCKIKMYDKLRDFANGRGFEIVVDGNNISDLLEDRPGTMANYDKDIFSPLVYAGLMSDEVKEALEKFNMSYSTSTTCLATRITGNIEITPKKINRISYAESLIKNITGNELVRVRDDNNIARIEVGDVEKLLNSKIISHINAELKAVNFNRVTLDIEGYRTLQKDLVAYKPCKDEKNKIMFETELPYDVNIKDTCNELKSIGEVKCSDKMGIAMIELTGRNVTIFKTGKIVARRVINEDDAQNLLIKVLPKIRRKI